MLDIRDHGGIFGSGGLRRGQKVYIDLKGNFVEDYGAFLEKITISHPEQTQPFVVAPNNYFFVGGTAYHKETLETTIKSGGGNFFLPAADYMSGLYARTSNSKYIVFTNSYSDEYVEYIQLEAKRYSQPLVVTKVRYHLWTGGITTLWTKDLTVPQQQDLYNASAYVDSKDNIIISYLHDSTTGASGARGFRALNSSGDTLNTSDFSAVQQVTSSRDMVGHFQLSGDGTLSYKNPDMSTIWTSSTKIPSDYRFATGLNTNNLSVRVRNNEFFIGCGSNVSSGFLGRVFRYSMQGVYLGEFDAQSFDDGNDKYFTETAIRNLDGTLFKSGMKNIGQFIFANKEIGLFIASSNFYPKLIGIRSRSFRM